eukprot:COSAG06_NODE_6339_length_2978_cov_2.675234_3_plen_20_part_01
MACILALRKTLTLGGGGGGG